MSVKADQTLPSRRGPRPIRQVFTDTLKRLSGPNGSQVNVRTLKDALSWEDERFERVKKELIDSGQIETRPGGPGGSLAIKASQPSAPAALNVFISYSNVDAKIREGLALHLTPLQRAGMIIKWHDQKLVPGDRWEDRISAELERADLVLMIVSVDFLNSDYCYRKEMQRALDRNARNECRVIPIIARPCLWEESPLRELHALPTGIRAISTWPNPDEAFVDVARGIKAAVEEMRRKRATPA